MVTETKLLKDESVSEGKILLRKLKSAHEINLNSLKLIKKRLWWNCDSLENVRALQYEEKFINGAGQDVQFCDSLQTRISTHVCINKFLKFKLHFSQH